jgi:hypothetical protein
MRALVDPEECWFCDDDAPFHCRAKSIQLALWHLIAAELSPDLLARLGCASEVQVQRMLRYDLVIGSTPMV